LGLKRSRHFVSCGQVTNSCLIGANITGPGFRWVADRIYALFLQIAACTLFGFLFGFL
jgi:hypothetical protein